MSQVYRGYSISPVGSVIGLAWALVDGFIAGAVFALIYNFLVDKLGKKFLSNQIIMEEDDNLHEN